MEWTQCPQCGLVAEVVDRDVWPSTDGPVEHVHVRCVDKHRFVLPVASLALHHQDAAPVLPRREMVRVRARVNPQRLQD
jgi:hypothetical protein